MSTLPQRGPSCPPAQQLEAHLAKELVPGLEAHLSGCAACRAYLTELEAEQVAFRVRYPTDALLARHPVARPKSRGLPFWIFAGAALASIIVGVVVVTRAPSDDVHFKGGGSFTVLVQPMGERGRPLGTTERLHRGDALRFSFTAPADGHVAVFDLDASGASTLVPFHGTQPLAVKAGAPTAFPDSIVLDESTGPEWVIAVFSPVAFELEPVLGQLRAQSSQAERVSLSCDGCDFEAVRFEKVR
ncbi:MAG: DUF4384 domain-containing protein [Archangiaceae bacterium]|nr:DUF4384 domain-containing protein [Archangiaceae bacterium]